MRAARRDAEELIYNLCDNAVRYNKEHGSVTVTVENTPGGAPVCARHGHRHCRSAPRARIRTLYRVDKSRSKETGGHGPWPCHRQAHRRRHRRAAFAGKPGGRGHGHHRAVPAPAKPGTVGAAARNLPARAAMRAPSCRGGRRFFCRPQAAGPACSHRACGERAKRPGKASGTQSCTGMQAAPPKRAAPACRAGGQRRLSPGRAVQCAYFSTAGPDILGHFGQGVLSLPRAEEGRKKEICAPYACKCRKQKQRQAAHRYIPVCSLPFFAKYISMRESAYRAGPFRLLKQPPPNGPPGRPGRRKRMDRHGRKAKRKKALPSTRRAAARKHCPLKGNFCAQPLHICLTGTKGICGKLPLLCIKIAVSGVLCGFGRAALEEECAKKFSKSDGLPGVLRVPGVKAASQNRRLLASTHLVQGGIYTFAPRAKRRPRAPGVHGAASPCKKSSSRLCRWR